MILRRRPGAFIPRMSEGMVTDPLLARDVEMWAFLLPADPGRLQTLVDQQLNEPSQGVLQYRSIGRMVMLSYQELHTIPFSTPQGQPAGTLQEREVAVWVPVASTRARGRIIEHMGWFVPFMFVDHPWAMISGREALGLPKELSSFQTKRDGESLERMTMRVDGLERFSERAHPKPLPLVELQRAQGAAPRFSPSSLWDPALLSLPSPRLLRDLLRRQVRLITLKQVRDSLNFQRACYQSILELGVRILKLRAFSRLEVPYEVQVRDLPTHPIVQQLGLAVPGQAAGWSVRMDFRFERYEERWRLRQ